MCEVELVQDEHVWLKMYMFYSEVESNELHLLALL